MPLSTDELSGHIRRYCMAHPCALDTLEGIAWWIALQYCQEARADVSAAVCRLVDEGVLVRYGTRDGVIVFGCKAKQDHEV